MARIFTVRTLLGSALLTFAASTLLGGTALAGDLDDIANQTPPPAPAAEAAAPAPAAAEPAAAAPAAAAPAAKTTKQTSKAAKAAAAKGGKAAKDAGAAKAEGKAAGPAAKAGVSKADIDLWAFSVSNKLAPGKTVAEFAALPGLTDQKTQALEGSDDAATNKNPSQAVTFSFGNDLRVRVINFGDQAFITHVRVSGERELQDGLKIGAPRAELEAQLGKPTRGSTTYAVYEGATDVVRCFYSNNLLTAVEIDRGN